MGSRAQFVEMKKENFQNSVTQNLISAPPFPLAFNMEELVISGISGKFPESSNLKEFKENLFKGVDMVTDDGRRWTPGIHGLPTRSGKLKELDKFDAMYFSVHAKQAHQMDPQLRILLELTHEAILDAGVNPMTIRGSRTGVFIGASASESETGLVQEPDSVSGYSLTGCTRSMFANRISFTFDFKGPSYAIDTACSSSLLALEQAVCALRLGHCDSAVVGGVHLCLSPLTSLQFYSLNMLSPEGKCRSFDASGNGYVRSEAAVVIFIQKKSTALRSYATILHAKTLTDGYKEKGITFPSGQEQQILLEETYREAGVEPRDVNYLEAHGTGTKIGDPQELNAVAQVFCKNRTKENPLLIGSIKSNIGHSEPASGLCSIAKVLLSMQFDTIPANLHYNSPNPEISALVDGRLKVVAENTPWSGGIVGVNSFGFGGANVHVILKSNSKKTSSIKQMKMNSFDFPIIVPFLGRTKQAVEFALKSVNARDSEQIALLHQISRQPLNAHPCRGFSIVDNDSQDNSSDAEISEISLVKNGDRKPIWFIFSGMGSQYPQMAKSLMRIPVFNNSIQNSAAILKHHDPKFSLLNILKDENETIFENVQNSFVSITAIQIALVDLLKSIDIEPEDGDGIIGHSSGELAAAYLDGCFTAQDTILAAHARGQAFLQCKTGTENSSLVIDGAMAAVGLSWEEAKRRCEEFSGAALYPACHNSDDSVTISGPKSAIQEFVENLKNEGIFAKEVNSSNQAFHCHHIKPVGPALKRLLEKIIQIPQKRSKKWISSSIEESKWDSALAQSSSVDYHVNNLLSPVLFRDAVSHVPKENCIVVEIGPHCILQSILKRSLPQCDHIGLLNKNKGDNLKFLLNSLGQLFNLGVNPNFSNLYNKVEFPVSVDTASISPLVRWQHDTCWKVIKFGSKTSGETVVEISLKNPGDEFYSQHNIDGRIIFPASGYLFLVWQTFARRQGKSIEEFPVVFENVRILRATVLPKDGTPVRFHLNIFEGTGEFQVREGDAVVGSGSIREMIDNPIEIHGPESKSKSKDFLPLNPDSYPEFQEDQSKFIPLDSIDMYKEFRLRGYNYAGIFQGIQKADNEGNWAHIEWNQNWVAFLDTVFQVAIICKDSHLFLPTGIEKLTLDPRPLLTLSKNRQEQGQSTPLQLPVYHYKNINVVQCNGIVEIRRWSAAMAPRKIQKITANSLKLEKYEFTPYFDNKIRTVGNGSDIDVEKALRFCIGIIIENTRSLTPITAVEISENARDSKAKLVNEILTEQCIHQNTYQLYTLNSESNIEQVHVPQIDSNEESDAQLKNAVENPENCDCDNNNLQIVKELENCGINITVKESREDLCKNLSTECNFLIVNEKQLDESIELSTHILLNESFMLVTSSDSIDDKIIHEKCQKVGLLLVAHKITSDAQRHFYLFKKCSEIQNEGKTGEIECENETREEDGDLQEKLSAFNIEIKINEATNDVDYNWLVQLKSILDTIKDNQISPPVHLISLELDHSEDSHIPKSGILGLVNCLRHEPGGHKIKCFYFRNQPKNFNSAQIIKSLSEPTNDKWNQILRSSLIMNVFDGETHGCYRHYPVSFPNSNSNSDSSAISKDFYTNTPHAFVNTLTRGDLSSFQWIESNLNHHVEKNPNEELCTVYYAPINFRDVMISTAQLPPDALPGKLGLEDCLLGMEFSGTDSSGKRVMGVLNSKGLATSVLANKEFLWDVPDHWTLSEAATVPVAYSTAYYALIVRGQMEAGESILIHSGSGGVGQAAIVIAISMNCTVYTTCGSKEKRDFLKKRFPSLTDRHIAHSRDTSFEQQIMEETKGKGVNLILNSLAGDKLKASIRCLAQHGRFLEIGKLDLFQNTALGMTIFLKNASVCGVLLDSLYNAETSQGTGHKTRVDELFKEGIEKGVIEPLSSTIFQKEPPEIEKAFRFMASGKHVGKILIKIRDESESEEKTVQAIPRTHFDSRAAYIIVGGLGGVGLSLAGWLIHRGARRLSLVSRSGITTGYQSYLLRKWRDQGVLIHTPTEFDLSDLSSASSFLESVHKNLGPIRGIFNLAMVLKDGLIENQTPENFQQVSKPKIHVTMALDKASRLHAPSLDYFVVFSSLAAGRGSMGLSSYAWANSGSERVVEARVKEGFCGLSVQFGPIADAGVLADQNNMGEDSVISGAIPQKIQSCLDTLDKFLSFTKDVNQGRGKIRVPVVSSMIRAPKSGSNFDTQEGANLVDCVRHILGLPTGEGAKTCEPSTRLIELGMDSLMGAEIKQLIEVRYGLVLGPADIIQLTWEKLYQIQNGEKPKMTDPSNSNGESISESKSETEVEITIGNGRKVPDSSDLENPQETVKVQNGTAKKTKTMMNGHAKLIPNGHSNSNGTALSPPSSVVEQNAHKTPVENPLPPHPLFLKSKPRQVYLYIRKLCLLSFVGFLLVISIGLRKVVNLGLKLFNLDSTVKVMDRPLDSVYAFNPRGSSMVFLVKCSGVPNKEKIIQTMKDRVFDWKTDISLEASESQSKSREMYTPYESLKWKMVKRWLFYYWKKDTNFQAEKHIVLDAGHNPKELEKTAQRIAEKYLLTKWGEDKPQWEVRIVQPKYDFQGGEKDKEFIIIIAACHAYGDAMSLLHLFQYTLADQKPPSVDMMQKLLQNETIQNGKIPNGFKRKEPESKSPVPSAFKYKLPTKIREMLILTHKIVLVCIEMELDYKSGPICSTLKEDNQRHCGSLTIDLRKFRHVRNPGGKSVPVTTTILHCMAASYKKIYESNGKEIPEKIVAMLPFSLPYKRLGLVNNFTFGSLTVYPNIDDGNRMDRLDVTSRLMERTATSEHTGVLGFLCHTVSHLAIPFTSAMWYCTPSPSMLYSNVSTALPPGITIFGGHKILKLSGHTMISLQYHATMTSVIDSLANTVNLSLVVDNSAIQVSQSFLEQFFSFFEQELDQLAGKLVSQRSN